VTEPCYPGRNNLFAYVDDRNSHQDYATSMNLDSSFYVSRNATFTDERLSIDGFYTPLRQFYQGTVDWTLAEARQSGSPNFVQYGARRSVKNAMVAPDGTSNLATASYGSNGRFTDRWVKCGTLDRPY